MTGLVIKTQEVGYLVRSEEGKDIECKLKGNFRLKEIKSTNPISVGDKVSFLANEDGTGLITEILTARIISFAGHQIYPSIRISSGQTSIYVSLS